MSMRAEVAMSVLVCIWARDNAAQMSWSNEWRLHALFELCKATQAAIQSLGTGISYTKPYKAMVVLPEYYFTRIRTSALAAKAMQEDVKDQLVKELLAISLVFPDFLLIPGTIAFRKSLIRPDSKKNKASGQAKTLGRFDKMMMNLKSDQNVNNNQTFAQPYHGKHNAQNPGSDHSLQIVNSAVHLHGGWTQPPDPDGRHHPGPGVQWVQKNYYLYKNQAYVIHKGRILFKYNKQIGFFETQGASQEVQIHAPDVTKTNTAMIHGDRFCLEICFDHANTVAKDVVQEEAKAEQAFASFFNTKKPDIAPDFHVVVSDWVQVNDKDIVAKPGGYLIHASTNASAVVVKRAGSPGHTQIFPFTNGHLASYPYAVYRLD